LYLCVDCVMVDKINASLLCVRVCVNYRRTGNSGKSFEMDLSLLQ